MMTQTNQITFAFAPGSMFAVQPFCTVSYFGGTTGIVMAIYEANCAGRIPLLVVDIATGREAMPFVDEVEVIKPAVGRGPVAHEVSEETAQRFADWNRRGNGR
jgi:hypothetical protein